MVPLNVREGDQAWPEDRSRALAQEIRLHRAAASIVREIEDAAQTEPLVAQVREHLVRERLSGVQGQERAFDVDCREPVEQRCASRERGELETLHVELEQRRGAQVARPDERGQGRHFDRERAGEPGLRKERALVLVGASRDEQSSGSIT